MLYAVIIIALSQYAEGNQLVELSIVASIVIAALLVLAIYSYIRIKSIRRAIANLRKVEIKDDLIVLDTINGTYAAKTQRNNHMLQDHNRERS